MCITPFKNLKKKTMKRNPKNHSQKSKIKENVKKEEEKKKIQSKNSSFNLFSNFLLNFHKYLKFQPENQFHFTLTDILLCILVTCFSLYTHFLEFGEPNTVVFDEVYFGNFTNYYLKGSYFFDIHPPLGKELLYFGSKITGYKGDLIFSQIGQKFQNDHIKQIRFWPSLTGSLITPFVYFILRLNDCSYLWSCVCSILPALDNAMLVESRFVLIDAYLWFFAVLCVFFCSLTIRFPNKSVTLAIFTGLVAGATTSVKFTGAGVAVGVVIAFFMNFPFFEALFMSLCAGFSGVFVLISSFILHFSLLNHPGPGCVFHPREFCINLRKGKLNFLVETFKLIKIMLTSNFGIVETHPYSSKWWEWPLQLGYGNWMWFVGQKQIWCVGSPIVWYFSFFGMVLFVIFSLFNRKLRGSIWIFICYLLSYLPFSLIKRAMWNYHYIIPLELSLITAGIFFGSTHNKYVNFVLPFLLLVLGLFGYIYLLPVTNGHPITEEHFQEIMFKRWHY